MAGYKKRITGSGKGKNIGTEGMYEKCQLGQVLQVVMERLVVGGIYLAQHKQAIKELNLQ